MNKCQFGPVVMASVSWSVVTLMVTSVVTLHSAWVAQSWDRCDGWPFMGMLLPLSQLSLLPSVEWEMNTGQDSSSGPQMVR